MYWQSKIDENLSFWVETGLSSILTDEIGITPVASIPIEIAPLTSKLPILLRNQNDDHGNSTATATAVALNTLIQAEFEVEGDLDAFAFTVNAGDIINFAFSLIPGSRGTPEDPAIADPIWFVLYDQNGEVMFGSSATQYTDYNGVRYSEAGTYYIVFEAPFATNVGNYEFTIETVSDDAPNGLTIKAPSFDMDTSFTGRYDYRDDFDVYQVDITEAGTVRFSISPVSNFNKHSLALFDAQGNLVAADFIYFAWNGLVVELDQAGTYYLATFNEETTPDGASYTITADSVDDDFTNYVFNNNVTITQDGTAISGRIEYLEDNDVFDFEYVRGQSFYVQITGPDADLVDVRIAGNTAVIFANASDRAQQLLDDQDYHLVVSAIDPQNIGDYTIEVITYQNDFDFNAPGSLSIGTTASGSWSEDEKFRVSDFFEFEVEAGQTIAFSLTTDLLDWQDGSALGIFTPEGMSLGAGFDPTTQEMIYSFAESGTYLISVGAGSSLAGANYTVSAAVQDDDFMNNIATSGTLEVGGPAASGEITYNNDADWFVLELDGPMEAEFTFTRPEAWGELLYIYRYQTDALTGVEEAVLLDFIRFDNDIEGYDFTQGGTYFIEVVGQYRWARGEYSVTVQEAVTNLFYGDPDVDLITGTSSRDHIFGGDHSETIYAEEGNDLINGGGGDDLIDVGLGRDVVILAEGGGVDTIMSFVGFNINEGIVNDRIAIQVEDQSMSENEFEAFIQSMMSEDENGWIVLTLQDGSQLRLYGIRPSDLTMDNFTIFETFDNGFGPQVRPKDYDYGPKEVVLDSVNAELVSISDDVEFFDVDHLI